MFEQSKNILSQSVSEIKTPIDRSSIYNLNHNNNNNNNQELLNVIQSLNLKYTDL